MKRTLALAILVLFLVSCAPLPPSTIELAGIIPLSGSGAVMGQSLQNGMLLATEEINSAGGVKGKQLTFIYEDSKADPKEGVTVYKQITAIHNPLVTVVAFSGVASALLPLIDSDKMPMLMTLVSGSGYAARSPHAFRYFTNADIESPIMADFAIKDKGFKKIAVLYINDEYGNDYFKRFKERVEQNGGIIASAEIFDRPDSDFRTQLQKINAASPDAVYIIGYDSHLLLILKQAVEMGIKAKLMTNWILASPANIQKAGSAAENVLITTPAYYIGETQSKTRFVEKYTIKFGKRPDAYAAVGYDTVQILKKALEKATTKEELVAALKQTSVEGLLGHITADANGEMNFPLYPAIIENSTVIIQQ